jgi:thiol-disulfide isomerase/thioredoxin
MVVQKRYIALVIVLLIAAGFAGFGVYTWLSPNQVPDTEGVNVPAPKPEVPMTPAQVLTTSMEGLAGGSAHKLADWRGKAVLVNFWATWCAPCREEIPELVHLQAKYGGAGLQVVGIATDEPEAGPVNDYLKRMVVNYPMLMGDERVGRLVAGLGGSLVGLPYTVVLDRNGRTLKIHAGELHSGDAEKLAEEALATVATPAPGASTAPAPKAAK